MSVAFYLIVGWICLFKYPAFPAQLTEHSSIGGFVLFGWPMAMRRDISKLSWHVGMCHALQCSVYVFSVRGPLGHIYRQAKAVWMLLAANLLLQ